MSRWIISWEDASGDPDHDICRSGDTAAEAWAIIVQILRGFTWTPEDAEDFGGDELTEDACTALVREEFDGSILAGLLTMGDRVRWACDDGLLVIRKED